jgi:hypothetical protein
MRGRTKNVDDGQHGHDSAPCDYALEVIRQSQELFYKVSNFTHSLATVWDLSCALFAVWQERTRVVQRIRTSCDSASVVKVATHAHLAAAHIVSFNQSIVLTRTKVGGKLMYRLMYVSLASTTLRLFQGYQFSCSSSMRLMWLSTIKRSLHSCSQV